MLSSPIITLTTDWSTSDYFVGMMKGRLFSQIEGVRVVDITHDIPRGDLARAAFIVRTACMAFPAGTVHIVDVGLIGVPVAIRYHDQYFICSDNGLPHAVFGADFEAAVRLSDADGDSEFLTFPAYTLFAPVARQLCAGVPLSSLGTPVESLTVMRTMGYMEVPNGLLVYVNYVDRYGNAYLSIRYDQFEQVRRGRSFSLRLRENTVRQICRTYLDAAAGDSMRPNPVLTVSATGYLQLALSQSSLVQLIGIRVMEQLRFDFEG